MDSVRHFASLVIGLTLGMVSLSLLEGILPQKGILSGVFKLLIVSFSMIFIAWIVERQNNRIAALRREKKKKMEREQKNKQERIRKNRIKAINQELKKYSDTDLLERYARYTVAGYFDSKLGLFYMTRNAPSFLELQLLEKELVRRNLVDPRIINEKLNDLKKSLKISKYLS